MKALILSDHEAHGQAVRRTLSCQGYECPASPDTLDGIGDADLCVLVLSPNPPRGLSLLPELRTRTRGRILAVGPTQDIRLVLGSLRAGADDYLDETDLERELESALQRCTGPDGRRQGRLIAFLGPSGGSGCSTLAANVATVLARDHKSAVLADLKAEGGDLAALLDLKPTHTFADLCQLSNQLDRALFERSLAVHSSGVRLLAAPRSATEIGSITVQGVRQTLTLARALFPYVVADLDHGYREEQAQVLELAERIVVVLRLDFSCLRNVHRTLDLLEQRGVTPERIRVVVNRHGQAQEIPAARAEQALGRSIHQYIPEDVRTINRANNQGVPVVLDNPSAKVSRALVQLATSLTT
jgi:pilus assembly protein CpaE